MQTFYSFKELVSLGINHKTAYRWLKYGIPAGKLNSINLLFNKDQLSAKLEVADNSLETIISQNKKMRLEIEKLKFKNSQIENSLSILVALFSQFSQNFSHFSQKKEGDLGGVKGGKQGLSSISKAIGKKNIINFEKMRIEKNEKINTQLDLVKDFEFLKKEKERLDNLNKNNSSSVSKKVPNSFPTAQNNKEKITQLCLLDTSTVNHIKKLHYSDEWLLEINELFVHKLKKYSKRKNCRQEYKPNLKLLFNKLITYSSGNIEVAKKIVNKTISNDWSGIYPLSSSFPTATYSTINQR